MQLVSVLAATLLLLQLCATAQDSTGDDCSGKKKKGGGAHFLKTYCRCMQMASMPIQREAAPPALLSALIAEATTTVQVFA